MINFPKCQLWKKKFFKYLLHGAWFSGMLQFLCKLVTSNTTYTDNLIMSNLLVPWFNSFVWWPFCKPHGARTSFYLDLFDRMSQNSMQFQDLWFYIWQRLYRHWNSVWIMDLKQWYLYAWRTYYICHIYRITMRIMYVPLLNLHILVPPKEPTIIYNEKAQQKACTYFEVMI